MHQSMREDLFLITTVSQILKSFKNVAYGYQTILTNPFISDDGQEFSTTGNNLIQVLYICTCLLYFTTK